MKSFPSSPTHPTVAHREIVRPSYRRRRNQAPPAMARALNAFGKKPGPAGTDERRLPQRLAPVAATLSGRKTPWIAAASRGIASP